MLTQKTSGPSVLQTGRVLFLPLGAIRPNPAQPSTSRTAHSSKKERFILDLLPERRFWEHHTPGSVQTGGKCAEKNLHFCALR